MAMFLLLYLLGLLVCFDPGCLFILLMVLHSQYSNKLQIIYCLINSIACDSSYLYSLIYYMINNIHQKHIRFSMHINKKKMNIKFF